MALTRISDDYTGYFDSIGKEEITMPDGTKEYKYDRAKDARFQANMMLSLNTSGLVSNITDCFKVVPGSGLSVIRLPGEGWLGGHFAYLMYQQNITLPENNQIYYYIIRCMSDAENRCMYEGILMNPDVSTLPIRTVNTFDLVIAKIEVPAGVTQITESMITDLRLNEDLCGYVLSNFKPRNIIVTADDVTDTDTHLIPVKTKPREQSLRGDGTYSSDLANNTVGNYKFLYDNATDTMQIVHKNAEQINFNKVPVSYQMISGSGSNNLSNMLSDTNDSSYGYITSQNSNPAIIVFTYYDVLPSFEYAGNINVTVKIKHAMSDNNIPHTFHCALYDLDTGTIIAGTQKDLTGSTEIKTETFSYHFASVSVKKIGLYIYGSRVGSTTSTIRIYGSELNTTYNVPYKTLLKIDPNKVTAYNYTSGSSAVMGTSAMIEPESANQDTEEIGIMMFDEPDEPALPHGTTPGTALPYVKSVYMAGEYMIHDDKTYKCLEDNTVHPPSVATVAHKWELVI